MIIDWDKLETITGRKRAILAYMARSILGAEQVQPDGLELEQALRLVAKLGTYSGSAEAELAHLSQSLNDAKAKNLELAVALEMVKAERHHQRAQIQDLKQQVAAAQARAERAEARLHEVTRSFAYLIERNARGQSLANTRPEPLLLTNPINVPNPV